MENTVCYIYGLFSSENNEIKYVGQTKKTLEKRLAEHIYDSTNPQYSLSPDSYKCRWIREALSKGYLVNIILLEKTTKRESDSKEKIWIKYYGRENLANGTNGGKDINLTKKDSPTFSIPRARLYLKSNYKKSFPKGVKNVTLTIQGDYSLDLLLSKKSLETILEDSNVRSDIGKNITIRELFQLLESGLMSKDVEISIKNLVSFYKKEKDYIDYVFSKRYINKIISIPEDFERFKQNVYAWECYDNRLIL